MKKFKLKDLVSFGEYLLSKKRKSTISCGSDMFVYDADIENWLSLRNKPDIVKAKYRVGDKVHINLTAKTKEGILISERKTMYVSDVFLEKHEKNNQYRYVLNEVKCGDSYSIPVSAFENEII